MHGRALSPSPIAVFLLNLAERGADGSVDVGGRLILLRRGQVVEVRPAAGDEDLSSFLLASGRLAPEPLERCLARARDEGRPLEEVLVRQRLLSEQALRDVRRGLFLDRLVRGLAQADAEAQDISLMQAEARIPEGPTASLVTLVLDALERRAGDDDAGRVGARADHHLEWLPNPHIERAKRWARFEGKEESSSVASLLQLEPAAASRIAALVRAGLARLASPDALPAPPPRKTTLPPAPASTRATPPHGSPAPQDAPASERLPSLFPLLVGEPELSNPLPELPRAIATLDDPLDTLERHIAALERAGAPGPERAAAWRRFGEVWYERFGSLEEASRAYREAAAADPDDTIALRRAAELCAALGQADLALAYARAAVSQASPGKERTAALVRHALLCRRLGEASEALGALRAAATESSDPEPLALSAQIWRELERSEEASNAAAEASARASGTESALTLAALALELAPGSAERAEAYAAELTQSGRISAAIAVRADAARRVNDDDARRSLLLSAAEQAELEGRLDLAADLLARAFDAEPHVDLLYEPLAADLASAPLERAILLEEIAAAAPPEMQASWLIRAADAWLELPEDGTWEAELRIRALELEPENEACWRALREQAAARGDPRLMADGLERALSRGAWSSVERRRLALEELAELAERMLDAPRRAEWAWREIAALAPNDPVPAQELARLEPRLAAHRARLDALEASNNARELAEQLRDDPAERRRALSIYREWAQEDIAASDALERLERLLGEPEVGLELKAMHAPNRADRVRAAMRWAATAAMAGRFDDARRACRSVLEEFPTHREAALRLRRAARRLGDSDGLSEALTIELAQELPPAEKARLEIALATVLEQAERVDEAIALAEAALERDPTNGEAALLIVRHPKSVSKPKATFERVRMLLGDSPALAKARASVLVDEPDALALELAQWAALAPYDPEPALLGLSAFIEHADLLAAAIERGLAPERLVPSLSAPLASAITHLAESSDTSLEQAAALAVRAADAFGPHGATLRELAGTLALSTGNTQLRRAALERRVAVPTESRRVELLHELAALHREEGDRAAEARTHLRILAIEPHESGALERLQRLYAETGETDRLMAALALELEAAPPRERVPVLFKLAAANAQLRGDIDSAVGFLREAWNPASEDDEALIRAAGALVSLARPESALELLREGARSLEPRRAAPLASRAVQIALRELNDPNLALELAIEGLEQAPGSGALLLTFERLALELGATETAERTFQRLIDRAMGPHGRRALAYRRARWLERAGGASFEAYLEAFELAPQPGAVYASIERLARERGNPEALARAAQMLAEHAAHPSLRAEMLREAARIFEHEVGDEKRAFDVLARLWEDGDTAVEEELLRLATGALAVDPERGEAAFARILDGLRKQADDAWVGHARARLLLRAGRIHALGRGDLDAARATAAEALEAAAEADEPALVAEVHLAVAEWLLESGETVAAAEAIRAALRAHPEGEAARILAIKHGIEPAEPTDVEALGEKEEDASDAHHSVAPPPPPPTSFPANPLSVGRATPPVPAMGTHVVLEPGVSRAGVAVAPTRVLTPPAMGRWTSAEPPEEAENAETLERRARDEPDRAAELLRAALVLDPARISALRALAELDDPDARGLVSLLDPTLGFDPGVFPTIDADVLTDPAFEPLGAIWALLWEQASPLFRETAAQLPDTNARVTRVATSPEARAFAAALDALGRKDLPAFYVDRTAEPMVRIARTVPPSILAGPGFAADEASMRFALGRAIHLARSEHVLVATLPSETICTVVSGVAAAFGPADGGEDVPREAAALASELWRTMPARAQASIRELLIEVAGRWRDAEGMQKAVRAAGLRAGWVASAHLGVAVREACASEPELASVDPTNERGLAEALRFEPIAQLVRKAFSARR